MLRLLALLLAVMAPALAHAGQAHAGQVQVAVAANFTEPAKEIAERFERRTGHRAVLSFGASGQFYAQIANGAPFQVFLSADAERPQKAEADGLAVAGSRFTYATGRLVLWSREPQRVDARGQVLARGGFEKLAIADPKAAPYGSAAIETLRKLSLYDALRPRIVQGASITQAYQFARTGAAELGFVALSQVMTEKGGSRWLVPANLHTPIDQQAVLLRTGAANPAARAFLAYLRSPEAKAVIRKYGYEVK
ncbi:molybdate ABC transporter substrate-binding protein [Phenylobacterium sp. J426]|uniref:molybdate ABC transporter substrate-binding protein n=1 Tax=Phenylobacterium sp. J426 TaxID=2898439 RepID=UPI002151CB1A|nr:molybdate ABC transporter substrate-binding protein [Phenylobacterium sp. J426]MCR5876345.1 molybdate ABC transporter substrate-binding protein [Phenylobacterium sp. J426]